jgi:hypothetical protein
VGADQANVPASATALAMNRAFIGIEAFAVFLGGGTPLLR